MPEKKGIVVNGLVIRSADVKENDKIITILSKELGKIAVIAKGIKSLKNKNRSACQLFSYAEFVLNERNDVFILSEASLIKQFSGLSGELEASALSYYIAETVDKVCMDGVEEPEILQLALNTLYVLSEKTKDYDTIKTVYELRLALCLGILPDFSGCTECGRATDTLYFSQSGEFLLCIDCLTSLSNVSSICLSGNSLAFLRYEAGCSPKKIFSFTASPEKDVGRLSERHLSYNLQCRFKTLDFYYEINRMGKTIPQNN